MSASPGRNVLGDLTFGMSEAKQLVARGQDGWYAIGGGSRPITMTVFSEQRRVAVATGVRTADAESIVATHNAPLLEMVDRFESQPD